MCALRMEEAEELYRAGLAQPMGKRSTKLVLTVKRRLAWSFLRGRRSLTSQASRTFLVEHVGPERARLYQHDHQRCNGFRSNSLQVGTL